MPSKSITNCNSIKEMEVASGQLDCQEIPDVPRQLVLPVVVLREILKNLPNSDLLNLSLVNKEWNYEIRSLLRARRSSFTARVNTTGGRCKDLRDFASYLRRMRQVKKVPPFCGLTITIWGAYAYHEDWCEESSTGELDLVYEDILHQIEWKHLTLDLTHHWDRKENCAGFQLVKKIFHSCSRRLEEFSLKIASDHEAFIQHFLQDRSLSHLKTLKFSGQCNSEDEYLIKALVSHAPNLKALYTDCSLDLKANLLNGSSAEHVYGYPYSLPRDALNIPESIVGQLRLRQMRLDTNDDCFTCLCEFNTMVPMFLQNSHTTLISMEVEAVLLVLVMQYKVCLENVQELTVGLYNSHTSQPRLWRLMKSWDFTRIFPNLRSVKFECCGFPTFGYRSNVIMDMVEQRNADLIEPVNPSVNIKELCLNNWGPSIPESFTRLLVEMFPHIEKLSVETGVSFIRLWDYWLDLEELDVTLPFTSEVVENLDSAFCGIFPEEVAELRQRDEEYLRKVNIVQVRPSLACLKRESDYIELDRYQKQIVMGNGVGIVAGLRTFTIFFDDDADLFSGNPTPVLSKVSGLIAFERRSDLNVTLETNSDRLQRGLQHMEPYACVRLNRFSCRLIKKCVGVN